MSSFVSSDWILNDTMFADCFFLNFVMLWDKTFSSCSNHLVTSSHPWGSWEARCSCFALSSSWRWVSLPAKLISAGKVLITGPIMGTSTIGPPGTDTPSQFLRHLPRPLLRAGAFHLGRPVAAAVLFPVIRKDALLTGLPLTSKKNPPPRRGSRIRRLD